MGYIFNGKASEQIQECVSECQQIGEKQDGCFFDIVKKSEYNKDYKKPPECWAVLILDDDKYDRHIKSTIFTTWISEGEPKMINENKG